MASSSGSSSSSSSKSSGSSSSSSGSGFCIFKSIGGVWQKTGDYCAPNFMARQPSDSAVLNPGIEEPGTCVPIGIDPAEPTVLSERQSKGGKRNVYKKK